jgi:hypothetical protein
VQGVDFVVDGQVVASDTTAPYAGSVAAAPGQHAVKAVVRTQVHGATEVAATSVTVPTPPPPPAPAPVPPTNQGPGTPPPPPAPAPAPTVQEATQTLLTPAPETTQRQVIDAVRTLIPTVDLGDAPLSVRIKTTNGGRGATARLIVRNASGRVVRTQVTRPLSDGQSVLIVNWNGKVQGGRNARPGTYRYTIVVTTPDGRTQKVTRTVRVVA